MISIHNVYNKCTSNKNAPINRLSMSSPVNHQGMFKLYSSLRDFRLPPRGKRDLGSYGVLGSVSPFGLPEP